MSAVQHSIALTVSQAKHLQEVMSDGDDTEEDVAPVKRAKTSENGNQHLRRTGKLVNHLEVNWLNIPQRQR